MIFDTEPQLQKRLDAEVAESHRIADAADRNPYLDRTELARQRSARSEHETTERGRR
jgi:hypothetical protein